MTVIDLTFIGDERQRVWVADGMAVVWDGDLVKFDHLCEVMAGGDQKRTAPRLQIGNGHRIVTEDPLTIVASILCPGCGLHGWVRDGRWVEA